ncbi:MAG: hypothetical protein QW638_02625 [Candidatus Bathyarchaeia archaeon]
MSERLKREFIELLEKDLEFRYTVAGYLGLSEILKRMDGHEKRQEKLWEEVKSLREGQEKLWEEVKSLREGQEKLWEEVKSLREGQEKLWEEVKSLRIEQDKMKKYMVSGFRDLRLALGVTFEQHSASFLELMLEEIGYSGAVVEKKYLVHEGEVVEINMFCEDPLLVGESTISIRTAEEAKKDVEKLIKRAEIVEKKYGRKPILIVLSVAKATPEASEILTRMAMEYGIKLILGSEIEEFFQL